jgi:uncharacterized protein
MRLHHSRRCCYHSVSSSIIRNPVDVVLSDLASSSFFQQRCCVYSTTNSNHTSNTSRTGPLFLPSLVHLNDYNSTGYVPTETKNTRNSNTTITSTKRTFSKSWSGGRGHDLTNDLYDYDTTSGIPKINITGYDEAGFTVKNMIRKMNAMTEEDSDGSVYMNGSILVFPTGCFLWNHIQTGTDVTIESLLSLVLLRPQIEYLFIGCNDGYGSIQQLNAIQNAFRLHNVVVEQMQLYNAIGTFNLLNAEDRQVAAALIVDPK